MPRIMQNSRCESCGKAFSGGGRLCRACRPKDTRVPAYKRGYDHTWRKVRAQVLADNGIPKEAWPLYDVDHNPAYDPAVEPDHTKYTLVPRLHSEHSRKTAQQDNLRDKNGSFARRVR
ncbi:MAG: hypothetical protein EOM15_12005 [Spirochaetia bacterium]|nr:hypothetical protein [Spirochaetia bacterium]